MARASLLEDTCKSALNRVPDAARVPFRWTVNPYRGCTHSCHYCFARAFHRYLDLGVGEDFSSKIIVKTNVVEVLRRELSSPRWSGEPVAMGTATDPYQHCEGRYKLTRGVVEAFADFGNPMSMLTKSTMIVRDLDVFLRLAEVADVSVSMSVGTLDEEIRKVVEPGTPPGRRRLEILGRFAQAGIRTSILVAPVLPELTDDDAHLSEVLAEAARAGIGSAAVIPLHVRPGIRDHFVPWLRGAYPHLADRYEQLYGNRAYAPRAYQEELSARFKELRERHGLGTTGYRPGRATPRAERGQLALAV
jgi:DNA repair photolyase